ncbi:MAG TPA: DUF4064 domain-containing protein [Pyrinomonadaceae bacterium]|nr:DUF4064 domain-containing protein [Pyrinomonadaceae bacterium]
MTPEQHAKYLGWSHIGFGAFFTLIFGIFMIFFGLGMLAGMLNGPGPAGPPVAIFVFMMIFITVMLAVTALPSFIAGYGLLKGKKWAKVWAIISAVLAGGQFPMGTAVTVYTFWFLFSEPGKQYFERDNFALPPGRQTWANRELDYDAQRRLEGQYNAPPSPPDWR